MGSEYKIVNLEEGMPFVDQAIRRMDYEINHARGLKIEVIKIIHGYGSSGTGGKIRVAIRKRLEELKRRGIVLHIVIGEQFTIFNTDTIQLLNKCDALRKEHDLNRSNNGVTYIAINLKNKERA